MDRGLGVDVVKVKWAPGADISWGDIRFALGANMVFTGDADFYESFLALGLEYGRARLNMGANWISGDLDDSSGLFYTLQYAVRPEFIIYGDYNQNNIQKLISNKIIVPGANIDGLDCSGCDDAAMTIGIMVKLREFGVFNFSLFDVGDLKAPTLGISGRKSF